ncbi:MAG TPA: DUF3300 domain-containing protein [Rhizomicrobium sp.]|nr:DUF3300 domain-containing protein [Rhizomicrobium sp.]
MLRLSALCLLAVLASSALAGAQDTGSGPQSASGNSNFSSAQLDQLVAPVALYPDPLLADVLTASTYPLEVIDADRWVADSENSGLSGDDLTSTLNDRDWDPSVQSLVPFPQVLQVMDSHLDWTETLGAAFLAQPADVMDAAQRMRARAQRAGNLPSNGEETVADQDGMITVSPPSDLIYVPEYDPWCAFGDWPYPVGSPFYFSNWSGNCDPVDYGVVFGPGVAWPFSFWGWGYFDWHHHRVLIRRLEYSQFHPDRLPKSAQWQHDQRHRDGLLYRNARNVGAFGQSAVRRFPMQVRKNAAVQPVRPPFPGRNWSAGRVLRMPPSQPARAGGELRPGFSRPAFAAGRAHASKAPGH